MATRLSVPKVEATILSAILLSFCFTVSSVL